MRVALAGLAVLLIAAAAGALGQDPHGRLFPPEHIGLLEGPDRDEWQQPARIMDVLRIAEGARVADVGAGGGWFTVRLAHRAGPNGIIYAQDIQPQMLESIRRRVRREGLSNVQTVLGSPTDPKLPSNLTAVLLVDVYSQIADPVIVLGHIGRALAPQGRVGIVEFRPDGDGGPGPPRSERIDPAAIIRDAFEAGLHLQSNESFLRYQYLLVFGREPR